MDLGELPPVGITVVGVGGAGCNAVNDMMGEGIQSAKTIAINTDEKHLKITRAHVKLTIGKELTGGLGAGGSPEIGRRAAEFSKEDIERSLEDSNLVFLCAGMGGGTGTGASPVVADVAKRNGAIVVAVVTYPFLFERKRVTVAQRGIEDLLKVADTVVIIDNNRLQRYAGNLSMKEAFRFGNSIITRAVKGISDTIMYPSLMNIDYADVRAIMEEGRIGYITIGEGQGPDKVEKAVETTLNNPLLEVSYENATGALLHVEGGPQMTISEVAEIGRRITQEFDPNANVKLGARILPNLGNVIRVTAIVTGVKSPYVLGRQMVEKSAIDDLASL